MSTWASIATAADLQVMASTALQPLFARVAPAFEEATGNRLVFSWGASSGSAPTTLPARLARGEQADLVVTIRTALDAQIGLGHLRPETVRDLATSRVGLAVQAGTPLPDITDLEALRQTLLNARSVAYSSGISGMYVATSLLPGLGIAEQIKARSLVIDAPELVGHALLDNRADVGIQQMSELLAVPGIQIVGPLPEAVQRVNIIAAAVTVDARHAQGGEALIDFLQSAAAVPALEATGFSPIAAP